MASQSFQTSAFTPWGKALITPEAFRAFTERVQAKVAALKSASGGAIASGGGEALDQLERLAKLKASGALNEEEFQSGKRNILGL